jgi:hypothetical protein
MIILAAKMVYFGEDFSSGTCENGLKLNFHFVGVFAEAAQKYFWGCGRYRCIECP